MDAFYVLSTIGGVGIHGAVLTITGYYKEASLILKPLKRICLEMVSIVIFNPPSLGRKICLSEFVSFKGFLIILELQCKEKIFILQP